MTYTQATTAWAMPIWNPAGDPTWVEEVSIDMDNDHPGGDGWSSVMVRWYRFRVTGGVHARIECFSDGWKHLDRLLPMFVRLGDHADPKGSVTPADVIKALEDRGYVASQYHGQLARR